MKSTKILSTVLSALLVCILLTFSSCGEKAITPSPIEGEWQCAESYLENDESYTGFYRMWVESDGTFSMYDCEAGNPGISGTVKAYENSQLSFNCDKTDFDPPSEWDVNYKFRAEYRLDGDTLYISKNGYTLVFTRYIEEE